MPSLSYSGFMTSMVYRKVDIGQEWYIPNRRGRDRLDFLYLRASQTCPRANQTCPRAVVWNQPCPVWFLGRSRKEIPYILANWIYYLRLMVLAGLVKKNGLPCHPVGPLYCLWRSYFFWLDQKQTGSEIDSIRNKWQQPAKKSLSRLESSKRWPKQNF